MADSLNVRRRKFYRTFPEFYHQKARKMEDAARRQREAKELRANFARAVGPLRIAS